MWIYIFGSTVRGEIDPQSDVDVLAIVKNKCDRTKLPKHFLVYNNVELERIFKRGDLFSHHLAMESKLVYSHDGSNPVKELGTPEPYSFGVQNLEDFYQIAQESLLKLRNGSSCIVFDCGLLYMSIRDIAMILSYYEREIPNFSKYVPYTVTPRFSLARGAYELLKKCRAASTRGSQYIVAKGLSESNLDAIDNWLLSARSVLYERIQAENRVAEVRAGSC